MPRCECGRQAMVVMDMDVYEDTGLIHINGYICPEHGYLHHSALIYEGSNMPEETDAYAVYVRDDLEGMVINSIYTDKSDAVDKVGELIGAFREVSIVATTVEKRP